MAESWLDLYVRYAQNNEAPKVFHWWSGVTILLASLRRNVWFEYGYKPIRAPQWTLIIGDSGTKKTTAAEIAQNIVSKLDHVRILADRLTPEALASALAGPPDDPSAGDASGLIFAPELSAMLDRRQHIEGIVNVLLRLSDAPGEWVYETKTSGRTVLRNVALSFLAATAPDLLHESVPPMATKSGFLARFVIVTGPAAPPVPFPWKDHDLEREVTNQLYELSLLKGEMEMGTKARKWYTDWYFGLHKPESHREARNKLRAYNERKPIHVLRTGMAIAIAKYRRLEYTPEVLEEALARVEEMEPGLERVYADLDATDPGRMQMMVLDYIRRAGPRGMEQALLIRKLHTMIADPLVLKKIMAVLVAGNLVRTEHEAGRGYVFYAGVKE